MNEESNTVSSKTWFRSVEPIAKAGYMDGGADGQTASFQSSFDVGYRQGFKFGLNLGCQEALKRALNTDYNTNGLLNDPRRINCELCVNGTMVQEKIDNLFNMQEEKNDEYLQIYQINSLLQ